MLPVSGDRNTWRKMGISVIIQIHDLLFCTGPDIADHSKPVYDMCRILITGCVGLEKKTKRNRSIFSNGLRVGVIQKFPQLKKIK